jgi:large subunit ribosomal protein L4
MDATLYNKSGKKTGKVILPESVFAEKWNGDLVHQVVVAMQANARTPWAHTKDRSEVSGTGKKPWKQKGTGSARHGSRRSPIWRTGGVAHGPRNDKSYKQKINKKMRVKALYSVLSRKFAEGEILFLDELMFDAPKTKEALETVEKLAGIKGFETLLSKKKNSALVADVSRNINITKSFQNIGNIALESVRSLNPVNVLKYKYLILVGGEDAVKLIEGRLGDKAKETK